MSTQIRDKSLRRENFEGMYFWSSCWHTNPWKKTLLCQIKAGKFLVTSLPCHAISQYIASSPCKLDWFYSEEYRKIIRLGNISLVWSIPISIFITFSFTSQYLCYKKDKILALKTSCCQTFGWFLHKYIKI